MNKYLEKALSLASKTGAEKEVIEELVKWDEKTDTYYILVKEDGRVTHTPISKDEYYKLKNW